MSEDRKVPICPITFIGTIPQPSGSINNLFTNPYESKVKSDIAHSLMCDSIKQNSNVEDPNYVRWSRMIQDTNLENNMNAIMVYIVSNVTELSYQVLVRFLADNFTPDALNGDATKEDCSISPAEYVGQFMRDIEIESNVINAINSIGILCENIHGTLSGQQIYVSMDMMMSTIYSMLTLKVFNHFINDHINEAFKRGALNTLYELLYVECYGEPEDHNITIPEINVEYAFCSSILRESMERILADFRVSLSMVARTATYMMMNAPDYPNYLQDKNYTVNDMFNNNDYIAYNLGIEDIKKHLEEKSE